MTIRRTLISAGLAVILLPAYGSTALAGPEWCDDGSPPPNDFGFRPTGAASAGSSTAWLGSTTSGTLELATGTNTLEGVVAFGMRTALAHAGTKEPKEKPAKPEKPSKHEKDR